MHNRQMFNADYFGQSNLVDRENFPQKTENVFKHPIISDSVIWNQHINKNQANWMEIYYDTTELEDDAHWFQLYTNSSYSFNSVTMTQLGLSYSDDFYGYYKIAGFSLYRNLNSLTISRETYGILTFIGDLGGLLDGLMFVFMTVLYFVVGKWNFTEHIMEHLYVSKRNNNLY